MGLWRHTGGVWWYHPLAPIAPPPQPGGPRHLRATTKLQLAIFHNLALVEYSSVQWNIPQFCQLGPPPFWRGQKVTLLNSTLPPGVQHPPCQLGVGTTPNIQNYPCDLAAAHPVVRGRPCPNTPPTRKVSRRTFEGKFVEYSIIP